MKNKLIRVSHKKKQQEIIRIKKAKKNNQVYISPMIVSPERTYELFLQALGEALGENK